MTDSEDDVPDPEEIGIFFIGLFLAIGGIYRDDLDTKYRIALVTLAVLFVLVTWFGFLDSVPII